MINLIGMSGKINSGKDTVGKIIQYLTFEEKGRCTELNRDSINKWISSDDYRNSWLNSNDWQIKKYAHKLKQIASLLTGIPVEKFEDQEFKKTWLPKEWDWKFPGNAMKVREFLQRLGTEAIRNNIHENAWVNALFADYQSTKKQGGFSRVIKSLEGIPYDYEYEVEYPKWIITDTRFPNEAQAIKDRGGIVIKIHRPIPKPEYKTLEQHIGLHPSEIALNNWNFDWEIDNDDSLEILVRKVKEMLLHFNIVEKEETKHGI